MLKSRQYMILDTLVFFGQPCSSPEKVDAKVSGSAEVDLAGRLADGVSRSFPAGRLAGLFAGFLSTAGEGPYGPLPLLWQPLGGGVSKPRESSACTSSAELSPSADVAAAGFFFNPGRDLPYRSRVGYGTHFCTSMQQALF